MMVYYVLAEPCDGSAEVLTRLQEMYGGDATVFFASYRLFRGGGEGGEDGEGKKSEPDGYLIMAVATESIPLELPPEAEVTVVADPRRASVWHSVIVRGITTPLQFDPKTRVLPIVDQYPNETEASLVELPTCPVCLERLDRSSSGLNLTEQQPSPAWASELCPVCPIFTPLSQAENERKATQCMKCGTTDSPWACLLCGFAGCGRYVHFHAYRHFQDSNHRFSVDVGTLRIWDYVEDKYVHRIVSTPTDVSVEGQMGLWEDHGSSGLRSRDPYGWTQDGGVGRSEMKQAYKEEDIELLEATYASKLDAVVREHKVLLDKQIESQTMYYEQQKERLTAKV